MKLLVLIKALAYGSVIVNGFILDEKETSILSTVTVGATTTVTPDECKFDVFENCTERLFSIFNGTNFNKETLYDLYCGTNASDYIQCLKDKINPNCGPGTDVASFKESLSHLPFNYSTDDVCRYFQENKDLIDCQILFPKLKGYRDCITGETLNKTFDSTKDTCTFLGETIGCSYKYTRILCPSAMNAFVNSIKSHSPAGCTIDFKNTVEARSCDAEMLEACRVAFDLPSYDNISATVEFQCSGKSQEYSSCLHEVFAMCRDKNGFNSTQLNASLELLKNQTPLTCSKESTDLMKCTAMFPKIRGYRDCITGITLNKIVDPTDVCRYFETTVGCSEKYTDLMCPQNLNTLQNMSSGPQSCIQNTGGIQEEKSCDFNMLEACQVAYDLPSSNGSDTGESLYNFICSGRLHQFLTCAQKVNAMCSSQGVDVSAIVNSVQFYQIQSALTCSDKSGFIGYTNCAQRYLRSDDFVKCVSAANSSDACGTIIPVYNCNLNAILKECPTTEAYYKKYIYDSLKDCDATYIIDAGDQFMGTTWFSVHGGTATTYFMNKLGYDAMCIGNHEFDHGVAGLVSFLRGLKFPVVSANTNVQNEPQLQGKFSKSYILIVDGEMVGLIGYISPETAEISVPGPTVSFDDVIKTVEEEVAVLKRKGVNKIIALGHAGIDIDKQVAAIDGIDLVVGGHTNTFLYNGSPPSKEKAEGPYPIVVGQTGVNKGLVVQDYAYGKYLGYITLNFSSDGVVTKYSGNPILLDSSVEEDRDMLLSINEWRAEVDVLSRERIGYSQVYLDGESDHCRLKECNLGNLITDAIIDYHVSFSHPSSFWAPAAIALWNGGGIRSSINKGKVTPAELITVMPFNNEVDVVTVKGKDIRDQLEVSVSDYDMKSPHGRFLQMSGMRVVYNLHKPVGQRVVSVEVICLDCNIPSYSPLKDDEEYRLFLTTFLINGGDGYNFKTTKRHRFNTFDQRILMQYFQKHFPVYPANEGRIRFITDDSSEKPSPSTSSATALNAFSAVLLATIALLYTI